MQCKYCGKPVRLSLTGLGNFCSWECRKAWKSKKNKAFHASRSCEKTMVGTSSSISDTITIGKTKEKNGGFQVSETTQKLIEELGGKRWYEVAKNLCCNFDIRAKEGFCSYLFNPKLTHKKACNRCELGQGLMQYDMRRKSK